MDGKSYPTKGDTTVGNNVRIGDGATVGAHAVVTHDVAPYTIVGGSPAQGLRSRFDEATTTQLLATAWWDWPIEKITRYAPLLTGDAAHLLAALHTEARSGTDYQFTETVVAVAEPGLGGFVFRQRLRE